MNWYVQAWKKFADFKGRSRRKEYWFFVLINVVAIVVLTGIDLMLGTADAESGYGVLSGIFCLAILIPSLAVSIRRLHDTGRSGWWVLLSAVPIVGLVVLYFALLDSQPGDNQYGPNPKGVASTATP
jgi:uncharacterized membrane protein YhaH (DUF805 family)